MEFFETPAFTRHLPKYLTDDQYAELQAFLGQNPEAGNLMPGTGGFRKLRWGDDRRRKGKRGGLRVIYYFLTRDHHIWLFTVFGKGEADDLTPEGKRQLRAALDAELQARREARPKRGRR